MPGARHEKTQPLNTIVARTRDGAADHGRRRRDEATDVLTLILNPPTSVADQARIATDLPTLTLEPEDICRLAAQFSDRCPHPQAQPTDLCRIAHQARSFASIARFFVLYFVPFGYP